VTTDAQPERLEGYEPFFGLKEPPFSLAPDTRFLFASESHSAALAQVAYAVERREPLVVVTGEIGTGKTLLCRIMLQRLPLKTFLSVIDDPLLESDDLLKQLLEDFGVISKDRAKLTEATRHELVQTLHAFLNSLVRIQAHAVVMIDEAQHLRPDVLEQIRLLSNIDDARGTLLQIILVGQAGLEPLLSRPELRQLQQRVSRRFRLEPLNRNEVEQYIEHRLALARDGTPASATRSEPLAGEADSKPGVEFTPDAIEAVCKLSGGVPRVINLLCNRSLEEAHTFRLRIIDKELIQTAARALGIGEHTAPATPAPPDATAHGAEAGSDESFAIFTQAEPAVEDAIVQPPAEAPDVLVEPPRPAPSRLVPYVSLAVLVVLAGVAILFGVRRARPPAAVEPAPAVSPAPRAPVRPAGQAPAAVNTPARTQPPTAAPTANQPAPPGTPATPRPADPARSPVAAAAAGNRFDIIVASFRTDARATSVEAEVGALGLPIHRRVLEGWQQVVSGPFASRAEAEAAQQRIHGAGLTGTQIVPTAP
jgi:general secretion pathway protein A